MSDILADGMTWLASTLKDKVSTSITYRRGASSVSIAATLGSEMLRVFNRDGSTKVERPELDFTCTASDVNFGSGVVEPAGGDLADITHGSTVYRFVVSPVNNGNEPAFRYCDPYRTMVRIRGKFKQTV